MSMYRKILVPLDGSATAERGLEEAIRLAQVSKAELRLLHVTDDLSIVLAVRGYGSSAADWREEMAREARHVVESAQDQADEAGVDAQGCVREAPAGAVYEHILDEARQCGADLIVMGTHGRRGIGRALLGSCAENVVRHAEQPVLLVRAAPAPVVSAPPEQTRPLKIRQPAGALRIE